jgi:hypothetical protein
VHSIADLNLFQMKFYVIVSLAVLADSLLAASLVANSDRNQCLPVVWCKNSENQTNVPFCASR